MRKSVDQFPPVRATGQDKKRRKDLYFTRSQGAVGACVRAEKNLMCSRARGQWLSSRRLRKPSEISRMGWREQTTQTVARSDLRQMFGKTAGKSEMNKTRGGEDGGGGSRE